MMKSKLFLAAIVVILFAATAFSQNPNPRVVPPNSTAFGMSYADLSARWWQWATSMSLDNHPLADTADCSRGQFGPVWFLGGAFTPAAMVRHCVVPAGKAIFFPIINVDCSSLESGIFYGSTPEERRACAMDIMNHATDLSVEIDGVPLKNLTMYRAISPNLVFALAPLPNVLGVEAASGELVADGYYLLLTPLPKGEHSIHFKGTISSLEFTAEQRYYVTIE